MTTFYHQMVERMMASTRDVLNKTGEVRPIFILGRDKEVMKVIGTTWEDEVQKDTAVDRIKKIAYDIDANFIAFISESWIITDLEAAKEYISNAKWWKGVVNHPKRVEVVTLTLERWQGKTIVAYAEIVRDQETGCTTLNDPVIREADASEGRFSNLLPARGKSGKRL